MVLRVARELKSMVPKNNIIIQHVETVPEARPNRIVICNDA